MKYFKIEDFEVLEIRMQLRTKMFHLEEKKMDQNANILEHTKL